MLNRRHSRYLHQDNTARWESRLGFIPEIADDEWSARFGGPISCTQRLSRWSGGRRTRRSITPNPMAGNGKEADDHACDI